MTYYELGTTFRVAIVIKFSKYCTIIIKLELQIEIYWLFFNQILSNTKMTSFLVVLTILNISFIKYF